LWVLHVPHLLKGMRIPTKVLHEVGIFMKDGTDNHANGGGVIAKYI